MAAAETADVLDLDLLVGVAPAPTPTPAATGDAGDVLLIDAGAANDDVQMLHSPQPAVVLATARFASDRVSFLFFKLKYRERPFFDTVISINLWNVSVYRVTTVKFADWNLFFIFFFIHTQFRVFYVGTKH